eukprot:CAMPEP_0117807416 /NCGR_PEP_ID=MMETSP0948-20121206/19292_1 /TAXON_ID=44440 /ORGANISM="Chattonella subsalsa, Strain CCMP2191" /LENGTH=312 /DNA_ID=CAMNT_0005642361 /DNA_START=77 /DNA_END=1015 /DNA_ORIENTATION=+
MFETQKEIPDRTPFNFGNFPLDISRLVGHLGILCNRLHFIKWVSREVYIVLLLHCKFMQLYADVCQISSYKLSFERNVITSESAHLRTHILGLNIDQHILYNTTPAIVLYTSVHYSEEQQICIEEIAPWSTSTYAVLEIFITFLGLYLFGKPLISSIKFQKYDASLTVSLPQQKRRSIKVHPEPNSIPASKTESQINLKQVHKWNFIGVLLGQGFGFCVCLLLAFAGQMSTTIELAGTFGNYLFIIGINLMFRDHFFLGKILCLSFKRMGIYISVVFHGTRPSTRDDSHVSQDVKQCSSESEAGIEIHPECL